MISGVAGACWSIFVESAPYVLFGFLAAGLLKGLLPEDAVVRHLGSRSAGAVIKGSLLGIPLPLCSCGVIPAAIGLRRQGASRGASAAFLVSTPESGVDSIAITWALLDPLMTVARPVAAFITATVTGLLINLLPETADPESDERAESCSSPCCDDVPQDRLSLGGRVKEGLSYAFSELLGDIGKWLLIGIALAGILSYFLPPDFFVRYLEGEWFPLVVMLLAGIPLYICASASTPIAAALVLKGLSPGAALVFLLAGPATNAATITVIARFWGRGTTLVYLASIALCSLLLGWVIDRIYTALDIDILDWVVTPEEAGSHPLELASALLLIILLLRAFRPAPAAPDS